MKYMKYGKYAYVALLAILLVFLTFNFWQRGVRNIIKKSPLLLSTSKNLNEKAVITPSPRENANYPKQSPSQIKPTSTQKLSVTPQYSPESTVKLISTPLPTSISTSTPIPTPTLTLTSIPIKVSDIQGLVAYWNLNEESGKTIYDSSGFGITGTIYNINESLAWIDNGKISWALQFDGNDDHVLVDDLPEVDLGNSDQSYSISLWVKRNGNPADTGGLISKHDGIGNKYPFAVKILKDGKASFQLSDGANFPEVLSDNLVTNDKWRHIVAIRDRANNSLKLYVDNKLASSVIVDNTIGSIKNDDKIQIGRYPIGDAIFYYDAPAVDDIRIYSRALFDNEVKALYDFGNNKTSLLRFNKYILSLIKNMF